MVSTWNNYNKDQGPLIIMAACLRELTTTAPCLRVQIKLENTAIPEIDADEAQRKLEDIVVATDAGPRRLNTSDHALACI